MSLTSYRAAPPRVMTSRQAKDGGYRATALPLSTCFAAQSSREKMAHPEGFEPPTPRFVVWSRALILIEIFANRPEIDLNKINRLAKGCKPNRGPKGAGLDPALNCYGMDDLQFAADQFETPQPHYWPARPPAPPAAVAAVVCPQCREHERIAALSRKPLNVLGRKRLDFQQSALSEMGTFRNGRSLGHFWR